MKRILIPLKAILVSIVVSLTGLIPAGIIYLFNSINLTFIGWMISVIWFVFSLWLWGYLANRWWDWE